ncbi:hypothetical protein Tco_1304425 [Tanacetum coccineum]
MDNVRPRGSYSPIKRSYYTKPAFRPKDLKQDVKTFRVKNMTTAGTRVVVRTGKGKMDTDLKKSRWVWRPKGNYLDHVSKDSGSFMLKKGNPEIFLQDHAVVDSGCSSHMTGNKAYLSDYEDYNGGFVAFGSDPKGGKITGKGKIRTANLDFDDVYFVDELKFNLFSVSQMCDKKNSVLFTETECLILSPSFKLLDESQVVLRAPRKDDVYSLDLKNIVPSGGLVAKDSIIPIIHLFKTVKVLYTVGSSMDMHETAKELLGLRIRVHTVKIKVDEVFVKWFAVSTYIYKFRRHCDSARIDTSLEILSGGDVVDLTDDEDPTDEDGDNGMDDPTGGSVSLGGVGGIICSMS